MGEVIVDKEKLAYGLENGLREANSDLFGRIPRKYRLRTSVCGLVSTAIREYSRREDIPSRLMLSRPLLSFDPQMGHVIPIIGESDDPDPTVVDPSYSQFFHYVGLHWGYETYSGTNEFPPEKILVFKLAQRAIAIDWFTKKAVEFQKRNTHPYDEEFDMDMGRGILDSADEATIRETFSRIWNPQHFMTWMPTKDTAEGGKTVSKHIPKDTIALS